MRLRSAASLRLLCFDLENRPLAYWFDGETTAEITAIGWKWHDEQDANVFLLRRDGKYLYNGSSAHAGRRAIQSFRDILTSAGVVYGHNIRTHDLPLFNAALLREGLDPLPELLTSDTLRDYPKRKYMSASLENLAQMYGIEGEKQHMSQIAWETANRLEPSGLELARGRVVSDVLLQERLRGELVKRGLLGEPRKWRP